MFSNEIQRLQSGSHLCFNSSTNQLETHDRYDALFRPFELQKTIQRTAEHIFNLSTKEPHESHQISALADAFIIRYASNPLAKKILQVFDRNMAAQRSTPQYLSSENQKKLSKWQKSGQPSEIFYSFPEFTDFLEKSRLIHQIKISKDTLSVRNGRPGLLVEGVWHSDKELYERFSIEKSSIYNSPFVIDKATRETYTYLDNGKGLEKHHPFLSAHTPISTIHQEDYLATLQKAHEFIRPEEANLSTEERQALNKQRTFILQYVTSRVPNGTSNFHTLLRNPKHPYLRLIIGKDNPEINTHQGEVYEVGYGLKNSSLLPCMTTQGRFQSPDPYEYTEHEKIVTNIPITQEEAHRFYAFTKKYHFDSINLGNEIGFNFIHQNCAVYAKEACKAANITVPTQLSLKQAIHRVCPNIIRNIGIQIKTWAKQAASWWKENKPRFIPHAVNHFFDKLLSGIYSIFHRIGDFFAAFCTLPIRTVLGEGFGEGGVAFRQLDSPPEQLTPPLQNWKNLFSLSHYKLNLPGIAQEWQLKQPSTVVYHRQRRLTIVPPKE